MGWPADPLPAFSAHSGSVTRSLPGGLLASLPWAAAAGSEQTHSLGGGGGVGTDLSVPLLPYLLLPFPPSWKLVFLFLFFSFPHFISTTHGVQAVHFALLPGSECLLSTNTALWKGDWILVSRSCGLDLWLLVWEESVATSGQSIFHSAFHERVNQWGARRAQSWSLSSVPGLIGCRAYHIRSVWRFSCRCTQQELSCQSEMQALYLATGTWE